MKHEMHLDEKPFNDIISGLKKIEIRLCDEKRQKIKIGDIIQFHKRPECVDTVTVQVIRLNKYLSIIDLVNATPLEYFGPRFKTKQQLLDASWPYTIEKINQHGLLAIEITLIL